jgi:hypothetical protein
MSDNPLKDNDELVEIARKYFGRLTAGPVPHGLDPGAPFSAPSQRRPLPTWVISSPVAFVIVTTLLFVLILSAGHVLTTRRTTSVTPPPTASAVRPTATPPSGSPVPAVLNGRWLQTNAALSQPPTLTFYNGNRFELQISSRAFGGGVSFGSVVVNGSEIDLFNGDMCGIPLPGGVGRYRWTLENGVLQFSPLNEDPCSMRSLNVANQSYTRQNG